KKTSSNSLGYNHEIKFMPSKIYKASVYQYLKQLQSYDGIKLILLKTVVVD
ncbi:MAG: hypothetical protein ACI9OE_002491, partial [Mariniflexile sp.]